MKYRLLLILIFNLGIVYCQEPKMTYFQMYCGKTFDPEKYEFVKRIVDTSFIDNELKINLETYDNCAFDNSYGLITIRQDTIYLIYKQIPDRGFENGDSVDVYSIVMCDCPFEIIYKIKNIENKRYAIKLNDEIIEYSKQRFKTYPITFKLSDGDTINRTDIYKLKQGKWIEKDSLGRIIFDGVYINDDWKDGYDLQYFNNGLLKSRTVRKNYDLVSYEEYDENGKIKKIRKK